MYIRGFKSRLNSNADPLALPSDFQATRRRCKRPHCSAAAAEGMAENFAGFAGGTRGGWM